MKKRKNKRSRDDYPSVLLHNGHTRSNFAEAYRTLRTNLHFSVTDKNLRSVLITSAGQSEGKTVTAFNLGYTISQTGKSALIIDADLRRPMISGLFNAPKNAGLTNLLAELFSTDTRTGSLETIGVRDLFTLLHLQKKTGLLTLEDDLERVKVYFLNGIPVDISWLTRPEEKKLINVLIRNGKLSQENAEVALRRQTDTGMKLGGTLVNLGFLAEEDLKGPLNLHIMESFQTISHMETGRFGFEDLPATHMNRPATPVIGISHLYDQIMGAQEDLPFFRKRVDDAILHSETPGLSILPCGFIPPNPSELLGSERMTFLITYLKKQYDFLIVDTPPVLVASDALLLAHQTEGVALVVKAGGLKRKMVGKAVEQLRRTKADLLGVVLNSVDIKKDGYYSYYKYYSSYYSESEPIES